MAHEGPSSSSSFNDGWTYDVFVSFRGEDTGYSFTNNLYIALDQKAINTFKDDTKPRKGEVIFPARLKAIQESRIAIIVFSENYASSSWCLDELVKIIDCMKEKGQLVCPVFYNVEPSDVRCQRGSYGRSMTKHEAKLKNSKETVHNWRVALREASNLSGWHFKNGSEFEFIQRITEEISSKLNHTFLHIADYLGGLKYRTLEVMSLLSLQSKKEVFMVGIHGIGGIGKTTIAREVYNSIANQFEGSCFLADVRENSMKHGLVQLQETLLLNLLGEENVKLGDVFTGIAIFKNVLCHKKVLLVLDDVYNLDQVNSLAGKQDWFGYGSRIIITTRDKHLLITSGVEKLYEVKELNDIEALKLFSWNAFKRSEPDPRYMDMAKLVVQYAKGLPLSLNVIGSDLFGKTIEEWENALKKYERPSKKILDVFKLSYDSLDTVEKEIFLDIACFFNGNLVEDVERALDAFGFDAKYGIRVLVDKSLVTIDETNRVKMHDFIQELGRDIVREDSPFDPGKRRRLWHHQDVLEVLTKNTGTDKIEAIKLDLLHEENVDWNGEAFEKMQNLRVLFIKGANFSKGPKSLPNSLRVLEWKNYPSLSLPSDFDPINLVILNLNPSSLEMEESFKKLEYNLRILDLNDNENLEQIPDISQAANLEKLWIKNCENLIAIHDSVGHLVKLRELEVEGCTKLETFITGGIELASLEILNLSGCSNLQTFPEILVRMEKIKILALSGTGIKALPRSIEKLVGLEWLYMDDYRWLSEVPGRIMTMRNLKRPDLWIVLFESFKDPQERKLGYLRILDLYGSKNLEQIPDISGASNLEKLHVKNCKNLTKIHDSVGHLDELRELVVEGCTKLRTFMQGGMKLASLEILSLSGCSNLETFPEILVAMKNIKILALSCTGIKALPKSIEKLVGLECFYLHGCRMLREVPIDKILKLRKLVRLEAGYCGVFKSFKGQLERVSSVNLKPCHATRLHINKNNISDELLVITLGWFPYLKVLEVRDNSFTVLPACIKECHNLKRLYLDGCKQLRKIEGIPPNLKVFSAKNCMSLTSRSTKPLLAQALHETGNTKFILPGKKIPKWFHKRSTEGSLSFWVGKKFPEIAVCVVFEIEGWGSSNLSFEFRMLINGAHESVGKPGFLKIETDHVYLFDLRRQKFELKRELLEEKLNHVEVSFACDSGKILDTKEFVMHIGVYAYNYESCMEDILFENPNPPKRTVEEKVIWDTVPMAWNYSDREDEQYYDYSAEAELEDGIHELGSINSEIDSSLTEDKMLQRQPKFFHTAEAELEDGIHVLGSINSVIYSSLTEDKMLQRQPKFFHTDEQYYDYSVEAELEDGIHVLGSINSVIDSSLTEDKMLQRQPKFFHTGTDLQQQQYLISISQEIPEISENVEKAKRKDTVVSTDEISMECRKSRLISDEQSTGRDEDLEGMIPEFPRVPCLTLGCFSLFSCVVSQCCSSSSFSAP